MRKLLIFSLALMACRESKVRALCEFSAKELCTKALKCVPADKFKRLYPYGGFKQCSEQVVMGCTEAARRVEGTSQDDIKCDEMYRTFLPVCYRQQSCDDFLDSMVNMTPKMCAIEANNMCLLSLTTE